MLILIRIGELSGCFCNFGCEKTSKILNIAQNSKCNSKILKWRKCNLVELFYKTGTFPELHEVILKNSFNAKVNLHYCNIFLLNREVEKIYFIQN